VDDIIGAPSSRWFWSFTERSWPNTIFPGASIASVTRDGQRNPGREIDVVSTLRHSSTSRGIAPVVRPFKMVSPCAEKQFGLGSL